MPIHEMVAPKKLCQDLLYRINTVEIHLPPLRKRLEDIPLLVDHFLALYSKKYQKPLKRVNPAALKKLKKYHWPGNVRELRHAIEWAVIMSDSQALQPSDFFFSAPATKENGLVFENYNLEEVEKVVIKSYQQAWRNISQAARELGLTRTSLYRRLGKYGL